MATCLIGLGANLGDRAATASFAAYRLGEHPGIDSLAASQYYTTQPVGGPAGQAEYVNAAFRIETSLSPEALLRLLQQIENAAGRDKSQRWAARRLDLDLLLYDDLIIDQEGLVIPHPRMAFRRFVLEPAAEIAGELTHPTTGRSVTDLRLRLDRLPHYIAINDAATVERQALLREVADQTGALLLLTDPNISVPSSDSPSPDLGSAIEFLDQRLEVVKDIESTPEERVWLSDFWLGDALFVAARSMSREVFSLYEEAWREREARMPEPIVVVLFDAAEDSLDALQHVGLPVLKLNSAEADWNRQEVAAAVEALK